jgi:hypothetical protein
VDEGSNSAKLQIIKRRYNKYLARFLQIFEYSGFSYLPGMETNNGNSLGKSENPYYSNFRCRVDLTI